MLLRWTLLLLILFTFTAKASDDLLHFSLGASASSGSTDGSVNSLERNFDDNLKYSLYFSFEHFIPLVPNVKVRYNMNDNESDSHDIELHNASLYLYYELLHNDLLELDLGVGYRYYTGLLDEIDTVLNEHISNGAFVGYSHVVFYIPQTALFAYGDITLTADSSDYINDLEIGLGYRFDLPIFDVDLTTGFRSHTFDVKDFGRVSADLDEKFIVIGAEIHF